MSIISFYGKKERATNAFFTYRELSLPVLCDILLCDIIITKKIFHSISKRFRSISPTEINVSVIIENKNAYKIFSSLII